MVTSEYAPVQQAGNGVIVAFNFNFKILAASDLVVSKLDASGNPSGTLVLGTDYTVTFDPVAESGTVTYTVAPLNGGYSIIARSSNNQQQTSLPAEGVMPAKVVETMVDKLTMLAQEVAYNASLIPALIPPYQVGTWAALSAQAAIGKPFLGIVTDQRTVQLWTGIATVGSAGWVPLGGF